MKVKIKTTGAVLYQASELCERMKKLGIVRPSKMSADWFLDLMVEEFQKMIEVHFESSDVREKARTAMMYHFADRLSMQDISNCATTIEAALKPYGSQPDSNQR